MSNFHIFKYSVAKQFEAMSHQPLFCTDVSRESLWNCYLNAFPEGTNEIYRERREFDCTCCRRFMDIVGNVVAIRDGKIVSIWDTVEGNATFKKVAKAMSRLVTSRPIVSEFLHYENTAGTDKSYEKKEDTAFVTWEHFFVPIPHARNTGLNFVCNEDQIATKQAKSREYHDVFLRSLNALTRDAVETVLDLVNDNNLYKGEENKNILEEFLKHKIAFEALSNEKQDLYVWQTVKTLDFEALFKIKNNSIGTLIEDLSKGRSLESAVGSYETKVAPENYHRSTALVTRKQIEAAQEEIEGLGLTSALERRFAVLADISVTDIIFADQSARSVMKNSVFDRIPTKSVSRGNTTHSEKMGIEKFLKDVIPNVESIEVFFENKHENNLVSLVAPVDPKAMDLFKWGNGFSWSYNGDVTDSIRERVKKAGGNVTGDLCCRLSWSNYDDLDLHLIEPTGNEIYYGNRLSTTGGQLDVDMNAHCFVRNPVENIFYEKQTQIREGNYRLFVNNFHKRESIDVGFTVEIDFLGTVHTFHYEKAVRDQEDIVVAEFTYTRKNGIVFTKSLPATTASKTLWNLKSMEYHPVNVLMLSPNYWNGREGGNKHYMFMLDGCKNDGQVRGFFNEYLKEELRKHRKVLEIVGSQMKTEQSDHQLSGLGFSSTQRNTLLVRTKGSMRRIMEISF